MKTRLLLLLLGLALQTPGSTSYSDRDCEEIEQRCRSPFFYMPFDSNKTPECGRGRCSLIVSDHQGTWSEMRDYCRSLGGEMAKVNSGTYLGYIIRNIHSSEASGDGFWIGGSDEHTEGDFVWTDGSAMPKGSPFWGDDQDSYQDPDGGAAENCALMARSDHFYFVDRSCGETHGVICEQVNVPYVNIDRRCIMAATNGKGTWFQMENFCEEAGGRMLQVESGEFMYELVQRLPSAANITTGGFWIGGRTNHQNGEFLWSDRIPVKIGTPFWGNDGDGIQDPDRAHQRNCILMSANEHYYFVDRDCENLEQESHHVLCEADL